MSFNANILIVEDQQDLAANIGDFLEISGFIADYAEDGLTAMHLLTENHYDAIVLDIMLPSIDGFEVCKRLRSELHLDTPVIMLTARDQLEDKLAGFDKGADDYLVKPFELKELEARLVVAIKRARGEIEPQTLKVHDLVFNPQTMKASREDKALKLSRIGLKILHILMRDSPNIVSREKLESEIWPDMPPDSDALRSHLYNLRKVVDKPFETELIHTVTNLGYKICLPEEA